MPPEIANTNTRGLRVAVAAIPNPAHEALTVPQVWPLERAEAIRLRECEAVIETDLDSFVRVGAALMEIRDKRYYRLTHPSFELYCSEKWGLKRGRAYDLIGSAKVVKALSSNGEHSMLPANERQARELVPYAPEIQDAVWKIVMETLPPGVKLTAGHVKSVAIQVSNIVAAGGIEDEDHVVTTVGELLKRHITQEGSEAFRRQTQHIQDKLGDSDEWLTADSPFLKGARTVLGGIDLDPASCEAANKIIRAKTFWSKADDGLTRDWFGRVWLNGPFSYPLVEQFTVKAIDQYDHKKTKATIILTNNATDADWCQFLLKRFPVCFPSGRVPFWREGREGTGGARQGQAFTYLGPYTDLFVKTFAPLGTVMRATK